ncbi:MAG TPA: isoprenylcysteine carboxylmethyltransferase family protein [Patescibacteria group bacterium]|nr:isoprenylcysteine carboxylmethyltransferase family protein [Patescibacteria group bacterium]
MKKRIQLHGFLIIVALLSVALFPFTFLRLSHGKIDECFEAIGIGLILTGQLLRVSSRGYKSERSRQGGALIVDGPYSLVRNPMYLGIVLIGLGIVLALFNWWVALVFAVFFVAVYVRLIIAEEKKLLDCFGEEYLRYQKKTPRLFPRHVALLGKEIKKYLPLRIAWIKKEIVSIVLLLSVVTLADGWEDWRGGGTAFLLSGLLATASLIVLFVGFAIILSRHYERLAGKRTDS